MAIAVAKKLKRNYRHGSISELPTQHHSGCYSPAFIQRWTFQTMVLYLMIPDIDDAEEDFESEHTDEDPDFDDYNFQLLLLYNSLSS